MEKIIKAFVQNLTYKDQNSATLINEHTGPITLPFSKEFSFFDAQKFLGRNVLVTVKNEEIIKIEEIKN